MNRPKPMNRRSFLRLAGSTAALFAVGGLPGALAACAPKAAPSDGPANRVAALSAAATLDEVEISLRATPTETAILPGKPTRTWSYRGKVLSGDANAVQHIPGSYLGPILRLRKGQKVRVRFTNELDEPSIVHWHGLHVPEAADGHPRLAIDPGETYTYEFTMHNRAGTYWYHPHPHGRTGPQVLRGLAGLLLVSDGEERAAGLPTGEYDVPLVLQDRTFDRDNQFIYLRNPMEQMMGFLGERILVNGQPDYVLPAAARAYRLRLLNGSNSRTYKLAWHDGTPLVVIATDGGLLGKPVQRDYVVLGPGERVELWADFGERDIGDELRLESLPFFGGEVGGMMGGRMRMMDSENGLPNGGAFTVFRVRVERAARVAPDAPENSTLPERLSEPYFFRPEDAVNRQRPRTVEMSMQRMQWFLNGRTFEMEAVARDEIVRLGDLEQWEFINQSGMMGMIHPMHVHNVQFQVIERQMLPQLVEVWEAVRDGYVDEGWKDTVLVMPGERVKVLLKFEDYEGLYLYHCHNLEHEDQGMMRNYRVKA
jgi:FtsP/CotA-like multicopper oxidase with cupredoxin domain